MMIKSMSLILVMAVSSVFSTNYYVDFTGGSDMNTGISPAAAWQHVAGDDSASGNAAVAAFLPGDTVFFKGGVAYRGKFRWTADGEEGDPVVYKGDGWGDGRAILDGSAEVTAGWTRCVSAAECGGNADYDNIYYTYIDAPSADMDSMRGLTINLYQDTLKCYPGYYPEPTDPFYADVTSEYLNPAFKDHREMTDPCLAGMDTGSMPSSYVYVHTGNNAVAKSRVRVFDAGGNRITWTDSIRDNYAGDDARVMIANNLALVNGAGDYYYEETPEPDGTHKLYLWPYGDPSASTFRYSVFPYAVDVHNENYVTFEGFSVRYYAGHAGKAFYKSRSTDVQGVTIRNNEICHISTCYSGATMYLREYSDMLVENNHMHHCMFLRGILNTTTRGIPCVNNRVIGNVIERIGGTCISLNGSTKSYILNNIIRHNGGVHTNGISPYQGCDWVLVANNLIYDTPRPMTFNDATNIVIMNNIFHGNDEHWVLVNWGGSDYARIYHNTLVAAGGNAGFHTGSGVTFIELANNIIDGNLDPDRCISHHNLYTGYPWSMDDGDLGDGDSKNEDVDAIFTGYGAMDFSLAGDGPAVDAGCSLADSLPVDSFPLYDFTLDFAGNPRVYGAGPDLGALEYHPDAVVAPGNAIPGPSVDGLTNPVHAAEFAAWLAAHPDVQAVGINGTPGVRNHGCMLYAIKRGEALLKILVTDN